MGEQPEHNPTDASNRHCSSHPQFIRHTSSCRFHRLGHGIIGLSGWWMVGKLRLNNELHLYIIFLCNYISLLQSHGNYLFIDPFVMSNNECHYWSSHHRGEWGTTIWMTFRRVSIANWFEQNSFYTRTRKGTNLRPTIERSSNNFHQLYRIVFGT